MVRKNAAVQGLTRRGVVIYLFGTEIPASVEALIIDAQARRNLIATRFAGKSAGM
jgi:hypothetical protein